MANVGTLMVTIDGNTFKLQRELRKAETKMRGFTTRATTGFNKVRNAVMRFKTALVFVGIALAAITLRKSIQEFVKFEDAMLDLQKVMTDTEGDVRQFIGVTEELSNKFGESASEVLQGAANFKQAGFTVQEAFELQNAALKVATASELDVVTSSQKLIRILKGFKAPASEATRVIDILNEVSNKYATTLGELATGMAQLSPVAKLMGFTFEETAAILTPIIEVFGSGSEAAVAMRTSLLRLVSTQSRVKETLAALQVSQRDANGEFRQGRDVLFDVMEAFQFLDENQKIFVAQQLTGIRQAARAVEVFNGYTKVLKIHGDAMKATGSIDREVEIRLQSLGKTIQRAGIQFANMGRAIGSEFVPDIERALDLIVRFINAFREGGRLRAFTVAIRGMISVFRTLTDVLLGIGRAILSTLNAAEAATRNPRLARVLEMQRKQREKEQSRVFPGGVPSATRIDLLGGQQAQFADTLSAIDRGGVAGQQIRDNINALGNAVEDVETKVKSAGTAFEQMKIQGNDTMLGITSATQGWGSEFGRTLTDIMFGAEFTFRNIAESFARMITEMIVQLTIIKPIMEGVLGFITNVGTSLLTGGAANAFSGGGAGVSVQTMIDSPISTNFDPMSVFEGNFQHGGTVPGRIGQPVPIIAHGGEEFLGTGQSGNNDRPIELTVILQGVVDPAAFQRTDEEIVSVIADNYARGAVIRKVIREDLG